MYLHSLQKMNEEARTIESTVEHENIKLANFKKILKLKLRDGQHPVKFFNSSLGCQKIQFYTKNNSIKKCAEL